MTVTLKTTIGSKTVEESKIVPAAAGAISELSFAAAIHRADCRTGQKQEMRRPNAVKDAEASFELTVTSAGQTDVVRRVVPIHPYGLPVYATAGGSATADTTVWVEAAQGNAANLAQLANTHRADGRTNHVGCLARSAAGLPVRKPAGRLGLGFDDQRSAGRVGTAKVDRQNARSGRPASRGPRCPNSFDRQFAGISPA